MRRVRSRGNTKWLGMFVWMLITALVFGWINYNHPSWLGWTPQTFLQYVAYLTCGMGWWFMGIVLEVYLGHRFSVR